jgi:hypothetical protein
MWNHELEESEIELMDLGTRSAEMVKYLIIMELFLVESGLLMY